MSLLDFSGQQFLLESIALMYTKCKRAGSIIPRATATTAPAQATVVLLRSAHESDCLALLLRLLL